MSTSAKKAMTLWHGDFIGDQMPDGAQDFKLSDRKAMALVATKTKDVKAVGGSVVVSRNFGNAPAKIVLVIPANIQPTRFFTEAEVVFTQFTFIGEPAKAVDSAIQDVSGAEIVRSPVAGEGEVDQATVEAQSSEEG